MTKENSKRLYEFYKENGNEKAAADLLAKYPDFEASKKAVKAAKKEEEEAEEEDQKE